MSKSHQEKVWQWLGRMKELKLLVETLLVRDNRLKILYPDSTNLGLWDFAAKSVKNNSLNVQSQGPHGLSRNYMLHDQRCIPCQSSKVSARMVTNLWSHRLNKWRPHWKAINLNLGRLKTSFQCPLCYICCRAIASCYELMKPKHHDMKRSKLCHEQDIFRT